jgi:metal transporter CNNM
LQEIISEEIVDETDRYEDNRHHKRAKRMTTAAVMRGSVLLPSPRVDQCADGVVLSSRIVERSVRQRKAESVSTIGSPRTFENAPLLPGTSPEYGRFGQYGSLVSESPKS